MTIAASRSNRVTAADLVPSHVYNLAQPSQEHPFMQKMMRVMQKQPDTSTDHSSSETRHHHFEALGPALETLSVFRFVFGRRRTSG